MHCSRQQYLVAEWSGRSITVGVRARAREWDLSLFSSVLKCDKKDFVLARCNNSIIIVNMKDSLCHDDVT